MSTTEAGLADLREALARSADPTTFEIEDPNVAHICQIPGCIDEAVGRVILSGAGGEPVSKRLCRTDEGILRRLLATAKVRR